MYYLKCAPIINEINADVITQIKKDILTSSHKQKWHRTFGHIIWINFVKVEQLAICTENKLHNLPFLNNITKPKEILEIIQTIFCETHSTVVSNGERYFFTIIDDFCTFKVLCIKIKD